MSLARYLFIVALAAIVHAAAAQSLVVQGTVSESGSAFVVPGATVLLEVTDMRIRRQVGFETMETGLDGTYRFDLAEKYGQIPEFGLQVNAISPLHRQGLKIQKPTTADFPVTIDLELAPGCSAKGRVVDEKGNPVPDAVVEGGGARRTRTAEDGTFHLMGMYSETANTVVGRKDGFAEGRVELDPTTQSIIEDVEIVMSAGFDLRVRVVGPDGTTPVTSGNVYLAYGRRYLEERLGATGEVQFRSVPASEEPELRYTGPRHIFRARPLAEKEIAAREVTLQVEGAVFLTGRVQGPAASLVFADAVTLEDPESASRTRLPVAVNGTWRSGPLPRDTPFNVVVSSTGRSAQRASGELEILPAEADGSIRGRVDPWPAGFSSQYTITSGADGRVEMQRRDEGEGGISGLVRYVGKITDDGSSMTGEIMLEGTRKPGRFTARAYAPSGKLDGTWDLREELPPTNPTGPGMLAVRTPPFPGRQVVTIELTPAATLTGRAVRPDGSPIPSGQAIIYRWRTTNAFREQTTITSGIFMFDNLPSEPVALVVTDSDTGAASEPIWVIPRGQQLQVTLDEVPEDEMDPVKQ